MTSTPIPAQCTRCGLKFSPPGGIVVAGEIANLNLQGNIINCPRCGGQANFLAGQMNVRDGGIEMVSGPQWSWDLVEDLRLTLERVQRDRPADPIKPLADASPELAQMVKAAVESGLSKSAKKSTSKNRRRLARAVVGVLFALLTVNYQDTQANLTEVKNAVENVLHYVAEHGAIPPR